MTGDEVAELYLNEKIVVVELSDGILGMLIGCPYKYSDRCMIQVPGENEARKLLPEQLVKVNGRVLKEISV